MSVSTDLPWQDISNESYREYTFLNGAGFRIVSPIALAVSASGGHRIYDAEGVCFYIPYIWIALQWESNTGAVEYSF